MDLKEFPKGGSRSLWVTLRYIMCPTGLWISFIISFRTLDSPLLGSRSILFSLLDFIEWNDVPFSLGCPIRLKTQQHYPSCLRKDMDKQQELGCAFEPDGLFALLRTQQLSCLREGIDR